MKDSSSAKLGNLQSHRIMKRIVFTVTNDLNHDQRMIRIGNTLIEHGFSVCLVGRKKTKSAALIDQTFTQKRLNCFFQRGKFFYLEYNFRLFVFLCFHPFDVACAIDLDTILPVMGVTKLKRKPSVLDAHEYYTESPEIVRRPIIKMIWERVGYFAVPKINYHYTVGEGLAKLMEEKYGVSFQVFRNVPFHKPKNQIQEEGKEGLIVIYQGYLNEGRGLESFIDILTDFPTLILWLVGEGDLYDDLQKIVQEKGLKSQVVFWGWVYPNQLHQLTQQAHIGLNLLDHSSLSYYYSLANKAFDYIQALVPSIQMDFPEYRYLNEQYQVFHLVKNLDRITLKNAVTTLIGDRDYYNQLKENCKEAAEELTWEKESKELITFYREITERY